MTIVHSKFLFQIDQQYLSDALNDPFYRGTVTVKDLRHVILATDTQLELLTKAKTWYLEGTFKVVKEPITQLFSIHAFVKYKDVVKQLPLCFVLMTGRKQRDYKKVNI
ncbi:hypothetical protein DPMN_024254 [Dreissena polymorpha]|uniref:Uncharacterized protein n=1 Tax=Dreissena polymorpha TaxID=45954 RepID=A0A9D4LPE2_DREPO|nr:hypothetical protein DPMN_024254 [Dreissena polymorpha]